MQSRHCHVTYLHASIDSRGGLRVSAVASPLLQLSSADRSAMKAAHASGHVPDDVCELFAHHFVQSDIDSMKARGYACSAVVQTQPGSLADAPVKSLLLVIDGANEQQAGSSSSFLYVALYEAARSATGWSLRKAFGSVLPLTKVRGRLYEPFDGIGDAQSTLACFCRCIDAAAFS